MKQQSSAVDIRIKRFMKQKMMKYPELYEEREPLARNVRKDYVWENFKEFFSTHDKGGHYVKNLSPQ